MAETLKLRNVLLHPWGAVVPWWDEEKFPQVGDRVYLVLVERQRGAYNDHTERSRYKVSYRVSRTVPKTNRGVPRAQGWLGTTDNVYYEALGLYEVVGNTQRTTHFKRIDADQEVEES